MNEDLTGTARLDVLAQMAGEALDWQVMFVRCAPGTVQVGDRWSDDHPPMEPLGSNAEVKENLVRVLPDLVWQLPHAPERGYVQRERLRLDFNVHFDHTNHDVMLHVTGEGDPLPAVSEVARSLGWIAVDLTTWSVLDPLHPSSEGWSRVKEAIERNRGKKFWPWS